MSIGEEGTRGVSSVEVYGFVGWISSFVAYVLYLVWAYTPPHLLARIGVTYFPTTYWALAIPAWCCVTVLCLILGYEAYNATLGQIPDDPAVVAAPFCPIDMEHGPLPQLFSRPGQTEILPLLELPASVVEDVLRHGMKPADAEARWSALNQRTGPRRARISWQQQPIIGRQGGTQ